ncbi:uncharacterized protein LOC125498864 [Beta vulgaris subsp. vulgaris]|uniref:uncharacterized protein LOC125498864 n=1 Tax=Beta vulgaris subsp. vulgaris TaxID=3555 RepID=UPI0020369EBC|nr:uncharacterized protein LOC125498864 [Beta vulgaris subsp. vulgaris]
MGGEIKLFNDLPVDIDVNYLKSIVNSLGYSNVIKLHYCDPLKDIETGIRFLDYDNTTFTTFRSFLLNYKIVDVWTEHFDGDKHDSDDDTEGNGPIRGDCHFNFGDSQVDGSTWESQIDRSEESDNNIEDEHVILDEQVVNLNDDIDFDEEGTDNEDEEVQDARSKIKADKKKELQYYREVESLDRLTARSAMNSINEDSDYEDDSDLNSMQVINKEAIDQLYQVVKMQMLDVEVKLLPLIRLKIFCRLENFASWSIAW